MAPISLMTKLPLHLGAVLLVLLSHVLVNIANSYISEYLWDDSCSSGADLLSCQLLVFLLLFYLIVARPKLVRKYGLPIIQAELFLQFVHVVILCNLLSLRICDVFPVFGDNTFGCLNLFKTILALALAGVLIKVVADMLLPKSDGCSGCCCNPCCCNPSDSDGGMPKVNMQHGVITPPSSGSMNRNNANCGRTMYTTAPRRPYCRDM